MGNAAIATRLESWGRAFPPQLEALDFFDRWAPFPQSDGFLLPYGCGRSYGDECLNHSHKVIRTRGLSRFIQFDAQAGMLECESGVTLNDLICLSLPRGWFPSVVPGTGCATIGGAIANDIHGKNHHRVGAFGRHVRSFELLRSDGTRLRCSPEENAGLYSATIGGLGLTGLITTARLVLHPVKGPWLEQRAERFRSIEEFFDLDDDPANDRTYIVSWVDALSPKAGRGVFFAAEPSSVATPWKRPRRPDFPFVPPVRLVTRPGIRLFNEVYYRSPRGFGSPRLIDVDSFFFSLDALGHWNRLYGRDGFFQHQSVVPRSSEGRRALQEIIAFVRQNGGSSLGVLKRFGDLASPGLLSFPMPGYTLALDFANAGSSTRRILDTLDGIVINAGGRVYPAKDARMSATTFSRSFPRWAEFAAHIDPRFSSSFWRRVAQTGAENSC